MQSFEEIEMQLWDYIDNRCSEEERIRIAVLITQDPIWGKLYEEIAAANEMLLAPEAEHTSMRFTKNVMEAVSTTSIAPRTTKYLNHALIKAIAGLMLACMAALLVYIIAATDWSTAPSTAANDINLDWMSHPLVLQVAGFIVVILLLAFTDGLLRRKPFGGNVTL
jgi:anti-sigma factor RsiW